ncbi:MAG: hypothetical protein K0U45_08535 [Alphaproteobacteria bacterium]|nr:hypothetical protein [Alphaproteobacteria bacterium]
MAFNKLVFRFSALAFIFTSSSRPRYCGPASALKPKKLGVQNSTIGFTKNFE